MIKKFFQALNSSNISYLLISGQATVIYGVSTFSEDIDFYSNKQLLPIGTALPKAVIKLK